MKIPTEPIGSIPRPQYLIDALERSGREGIAADELNSVMERAVRETLALFEETGSPVITDGEQSKPAFATYPVHGIKTLSPAGVIIPFADGHTRQLPASLPVHFGTGRTPAVILRRRKHLRNCR